MHSYNIGDINVVAGCQSGAGQTVELDCEAVAWNEAFATFWGVVWGWTKNATAATAGILTTQIEDPPTACDTISANNRPWRLQACITSALWDVFDDPSGDDDPIDDGVTNVATFTFADTLNAYPAGWGNRQDEESGSHGRNHWDFLANWSSRWSGDLVAEIREIYATANLDGDVDDNGVDCDAPLGCGEEPF